ncbi:MAG: hypothetical protein JW789_05250 [Candidatus Aenigmarchaeota archaeon]|nr:hypothetical protein [Candidatus Aenigmarchaeota archaeon]
MLRYAFKPASKKSVKVYGRGINVSEKSGKILCKEMNGKNVVKAKAFLQRLLDRTQDLDGKYYTKTAGHLLDLIKSAESNAEFKGLDVEKMVVNASVHNGFKFMRPRRFKMRRQQKKIANVQVILQQK